MLTIFTIGGGYNRGNNLFLSLSLSLYSYAHSLFWHQQETTTTTKKFALTHIYTNMTFRLFTNIASMDSQKHIYEYVSSSGSYRVCTIRLSVAGYSASGSHRVCTIWLSVVGYSSSGSHRVYTIRRDLFPNTMYRIVDQFLTFLENYISDVKPH